MKPQKDRISLAMPKYLAEAITKYAAAQNRSINQSLAMLIEEILIYKGYLNTDPE